MHMTETGITQFARETNNSFNAFRQQMKDIPDYRTMEYYRRRYAGEC